MTDEGTLMTAYADAAVNDALALNRVDAWWRAANYLSVGQIYLLDNPLLREPLRPEHVEPRLVGHWGTIPGITLTCAHLNLAIMRHFLEAMLVTGPGHGAVALNAAAWLEGRIPVGPDGAGMAALFRQFSFPGGMPSHASPKVVGSIHEAGSWGTRWRTRPGRRSTTPTWSWRV